MKRLFILTLLLIFLIGNVSALIIGGTSNFEKIGNYGTYEINNFFGLGGKIATLELTKNTEICSNNCESEIPITLHMKTSLVDKIEFYEINGDSRELTEINNYNIMVQITEESKRDIYDYVCVKLPVYKNGTIGEICEYKVVKTEPTKIIKWVPYNLGDSFDIGTYLLKINGDKKRESTIDWIIKSNGIWTQDWAIWGGINSSVVLNSPINNNISSVNLVTFNCSAFLNLSLGVSLKNMSLWTNSTGSWLRNETKTIVGGYGSPTTITLTSIEDTFVKEEAPTESADNTEIRLLWIGTHGDVDFGDHRHGLVKFAISSIPPNSIIHEAKLSVYAINARTIGGVGAVYCPNQTWNSTLTWNNFNSSIQPYCTINNYLSDGVFVTGTFENWTVTDIVNWGLNQSKSNLTILLNSTEGGALGAYERLGSLENPGTNPPKLTVNYTPLISAINSTQTFPKNISKRVLWNCEGCDDGGGCGYATSNYTVSLDDTPPIINVTYPINYVNFGSYGGLTFINWTISDLYNPPSSCWLDYNLTNISVTCGNNQTNITLKNQRNITMWANDSLGNLGSYTRNWEYKVFENATNYSSLVGEKVESIFYINLTTYLNILSIYLNYNGSLYEGTITSLGGGYYSIYKNLNSPSVTTTINQSFYWTVFLAGGESFNTTTYNQTVTNFELGNCSVNTILLFNLSLYDEEDQEFLTNSSYNTSIKTNVIISNARGDQISQYNQSFITNPASICINDSSITNYFLDLEVEYSAVERRVEHYNIQHYLLNSSTLAQNISLYDLNNSLATRFIITYKNENLLPVEDVLLIIARQYLGEGIFKTVEAPVTDSSGRGVVSLRKDDTVYNIYAYKEGELLATLTNVVPVCTNELYLECEINFNSIDSTVGVDDFENMDNLYYTQKYNNNTRTITTTFSTSDGSNTEIRQETRLYNRFDNTTICNTSLVSSTGSLTCTIPTTYTNSTIYINLYKDGEIIEQSYLPLTQDTNTVFGTARIIMILILMLTIPFMFIPSLVGIIIGTIMGLIMASLLLITTGGSTLSIGTGITWLIISASIIIWRLTKGGVSD